MGWHLCRLGIDMEKCFWADKSAVIQQFRSLYTASVALHYRIDKLITIKRAISHSPIKLATVRKCWRRAWDDARYNKFWYYSKYPDINNASHNTILPLPLFGYSVHKAILPWFRVWEHTLRILCAQKVSSAQQKNELKRPIWMIHPITSIRVIALCIWWNKGALFPLHGRHIPIESVYKKAPSCRGLRAHTIQWLQYWNDVQTNRKCCCKGGNHSSNTARDSNPTSNIDKYALGFEWFSSRQGIKGSRATEMKKNCSKLNKGTVTIIRNMKYCTRQMGNENVGGALQLCVQHAHKCIHTMARVDFFCVQFFLPADTSTQLCRPLERTPSFRPKPNTSQSYRIPSSHVVCQSIGKYFVFDFYFDGLTMNHFLGIRQIAELFMWAGQKSASPARVGFKSRRMKADRKLFKSNKCSAQSRPAFAMEKWSDFRHLLRIFFWLAMVFFCSSRNDWIFTVEWVAQHADHFYDLFAFNAWNVYVCAL